VVATQLEAYLNYWYKLAIEDENIRELLQFADRRPTIDSEIWEKVEKLLPKHEDFRKWIGRIQKDVKGAGPREQDYALKEFDDLRAGIRMNRMFITDEQAALLSPQIAGLVVRVRQDADFLLGRIREFVTYVLEHETIEDSRLSKFGTQVIKDGGPLLKDIRSLVALALEPGGEKLRIIHGFNDGHAQNLPRKLLFVLS